MQVNPYLENSTCATISKGFLFSPITMVAILSVLSENVCSVTLFLFAIF